jgi:hypothetical protein
MGTTWTTQWHPVGSGRTFLYGQIPDALGSMTSLEVLDFSGSEGSLDITTANMRNLCNLQKA